MDEAQQKFAEALKSIKDAQAAVASNFHDLAGDALTKLRRSITLCERDAPKALLRVPAADMLDVFDFLIKSSERKARKAHVMECLASLVVKPLWATAVDASPEIRRSLEELLVGHPNLLESLACPQSLEPEAEVVPAPVAKTLSPQDLERIRKHLQSALDHFIAAGWVYPRHSDKAIAGFRSLYNASTHLDGLSRTSAGNVYATFDEHWPNLLNFLKSLHEGRSSLRQQVVYVVTKLLALSSEFQVLLDAQSDLPWKLPGVVEGAVKDDAPVTAALKESPLATFIDFQKADDAPPPEASHLRSSATKPEDIMWVLIRVGEGDKTPPSSQMRDVEVHRFHDDPSKTNAGVHIDVLTHILDLILNQQNTKQVVSVIVDSPSRHTYMFADIKNLYSARRLMIPKFITCEKSKGFQAGVTVALSEKDAIKLVEKEVGVQRKLITSDQGRVWSDLD